MTEKTLIEDCMRAFESIGESVRPMLEISTKNRKSLCSITSYLPNECLIMQRAWHYIHSISIIPKCEMCDNKVSWDKSNFKYRRFCSSKCANNQGDTKTKRHNTNLIKFGSITPLGNKQIIETNKQTILDRYGVTNAFWSKGREYNIQKLIEVKNPHITKIDLITDMINDKKTQRQIGDVLGITQPRVSSLLSNLNLATINNTTSIGQQEVVNFLLTLNPDIEIILNNTDIIHPHHIDIYIPSLSIGIEFNGTFWHSELNGRIRSYHLSKYTKCLNRGIRLIQMWNVEWDTKRDIVKSRLSSLYKHNMSIYARKCRIIELNKQQSYDFFNATHIQGGCANFKCYALEYDNDIVAAMSFSKSRFDKNIEYELLRYSSKLYVNIVGGASKLLSHFISTHNPNSIVSYSDLRWNTGGLYAKLGFTFIGDTSPNFYYFNRTNANVLYSRQQFQKHKLHDKLIDYDPSISAWQNMIKNGYDRLWDCGSKKWVWVKNIIK